MTKRSMSARSFVAHCDDDRQHVSGVVINRNRAGRDLISAVSMPIPGLPRQVFGSTSETSSRWRRRGIVHG